MHVGAGVIEPDYTGEIKVLLLKNSKHYYQVKKGETQSSIDFGEGFYAHS